MTTVNEALAIIKKTSYSLGAELINTEDALGRITHESIKSKQNSPPFNMSAMDGYAINCKSYNNLYKLIDETFAGNPSNKNILSGQAIKVYTGSKLPNGTKAVIVQEDIKELNNNLLFHKEKKEISGQYIRKEGIDFLKNQIIIPKRKTVTSRDIGLLLSANILKIKVYKKPNIALLATGDELTYPGKIRKEGSIYASSLYMLESLIKLSLSKCNYKALVEDDIKKIKDQFQKAKKSDIIITTGGVSVGKKDLIRKSLKELGFKEKFWKVEMKPGKPLLFGLLDNKPVFSLPGNPVSSYVCYNIFILPFIYQIFKMKKNLVMKNAILLNTINISSTRESYLRANFYNRNNTNFVRFISNQDSSLLKNLTNSNCLIKLSKKAKKKVKGSIVKILIYPDLF